MKKLKDYAPGTTVYDTAGYVWERTEDGAKILANGEDFEWTNEELDDVEERFGPFTMEKP